MDIKLKNNRMTRGWKKKFVLFGIITLEDDNKTHVIIAEHLYTRNSASRNQRLWAKTTKVSNRHLIQIS